MKSTRILLTIAVVLSLVSLAQSADIKLRNGRFKRGRIVRGSISEVVIERKGEETAIPRDTIKEIDGVLFEEDHVEVYRKKAAALKEDDVDEIFKFCVWCEKRKMLDEIKKPLLKIIEMDPYHDGAHRLLGDVKINGMWWTPAELKDKGYVQYHGKWLSPEEAEAARGKVEYLGQWVTEEDKRLLERRKFSRFKNHWTTHRVADLRQELLVINLVNQWKLSKSQAMAMFETITEAERDRQKFLAWRHDVNARAEVAWLQLENTIMDGVIDSFDTPREIEGKASHALKVLKMLGKGYCYRMGGQVKKVLDILKEDQIDTLNWVYCGSCHCSRKATSRFPRTPELKQLHCGRCHSQGIPSQGESRGPSVPQVSSAALQMADKVRSAQGKELRRLKNRILAQHVRRAGSDDEDTLAREKAEVNAIVKRLKMALDEDFENNKAVFARQLAGANQVESLRLEQQIASQKMNALMKRKKDAKAISMTAQCFFNGDLLATLAKKLKIPKRKLDFSHKLISPEEREKVNYAVLFDPELFNTLAKRALDKTCTMCHPREKFEEATMAKWEWENTLRKMQEVCWDITDQDVIILSSYLSRLKEKSADDF